MDYLCRTFTSRISELNDINHFFSFKDSDDSRILLISGQSGTGKSFLLKEAFNHLVKNNNNAFILHLDLSSDEFVTTMLFESLIYLSWNEKKYDNNNQLQVSHGFTFSEFLNNRKFTKGLVSKFLSVISSTIEMIPSYGKPLKELIPKNLFEKEKEDPTPDIAVTFFKYLRYLSNKSYVYLSIDNYQFLQKSIRLILESHIVSISKNLCFIAINRTINANEHRISPDCFYQKRLEINLINFSLQETIDLTNRLLPYSNNLVAIAEDCYRKTNGNLKEIEYYLASLNHNISKNNESDIKTLVETLASLSKIEKYLITLASLFPAGIKIQYVVHLLKNVLYTEDESKLFEIITDLVKIGYLYLNGMSHELVKPAHEKIINSIKKGLTEDEFIEIHRDLSESMERLIEGPIQINDYNYLLHCYVGIFTTNQIKGKIEYVIKLFDIQYKSNCFYYIVTIYKEFKEIINLLPEHTVEQILDSCQKTSDFYLGMEILKLIENQRGHLTQAFKLFYVKYLTQTYHFRKALDLVKELDITEKVQLYHLNILQHLCEDTKAKKMIKNLSLKSNHGHDYYIILRNSAHYFSYQTALKNLISVFNYFKQRGLLFEEATALNNLGVVYLWNQELEDAYKCLNKAIQIFERLSSNELYEPLCNCGVLEFLKDDFNEAKKSTEKSLIIVNKSLTLDHIILNNNLLLIMLAMKEINIEECKNNFFLLYMQSKIVEDPWLHFLITHNLCKLEKLLSLDSKDEPQEYFMQKLLNRKETGVEVMKTINIENYGEINFLLSLSPHWRY